MSELIVHGRNTSSNVQAVMWTIAELGLTHKRIDVGGAFGGNDEAEFRAINPNGLVPALQDGELGLFESAAIVRYLVKEYGDEQFCPTDNASYAKLDIWAEWAKNTFAKTIIYEVFWTLVRTPSAERDALKLNESIAKLNTLVAMVEQRLGDDDWLGGDHFTFADVMLGHSLYRYYTLPFERCPSPVLDAYYARCTARATYQDHVMVDYSSLQVE